MRQKREEARREAEARTREAARLAREQEIVPWLRRLGFRADEARSAAALCESIPDAPLEERVRVALSGSVVRRGAAIDAAEAPSVAGP